MIIQVRGQILAGDLGISAIQYDVDASLDLFCVELTQRVKQRLSGLWKDEELSEILVSFDRGYRLSGETLKPNVMIFNSIDCWYDKTSIAEVDQIVGDLLKERDAWTAKYCEGY